MENIKNILSLLSKNDPSPPVLLQRVKKYESDRPVRECLGEYTKLCKEKNISCISQIIKHYFNNSQIYQSPLKVTPSMITNLIFISFLDQTQPTIINKLENYQKNIEQANIQRLEKSERNKQKQSEDFKSLLNKVFQQNISPYGKKLSREQVSNIIERIKAQQEKEGIKFNKNDLITIRNYINILNALKETSLQTDKFIQWFCQWLVSIRHLYVNATNIINNLEKIKNIKISNQKNFKERYDFLKTLADPLKNFGNTYTYILLTAQILKILLIENKNSYSKIENKNTSEELLNELKTFEKVRKLAVPFGKIYEDFPSVFANDQNNANQNCMSQQLNKTFYYRYLLNLKNLSGNKTTLQDLLLKENQQFFLKDIMDLKMSKEVYQQLSSGILSKIVSKSKRNKMLTWISQPPHNYIITVGEYKNKILSMKTIGHEIAEGNKIRFTNYNEDKINIDISTVSQVLPFIGGKNLVTINCDDIKITLKKNKDKSVTVRWQNKKYYNLIYDNQNKLYRLKLLCGEIEDMDLAVFKLADKNNKDKVLMNLTMYDPKPREVMMIFAIGYAIHYNMGKIFTNLSSTQIESTDCATY